MSNTLLIKHLCGDLDTSEREDFLKHFGAEKVWFINPKSHSAFASFKSKQAAEEALSRLHQLEVLGKRLAVEYAEDRKLSPEKKSHKIDTSETESFKKFLNELNGCDPLLNFHQPPPPNLLYKYPTPNSHILFNILHALAKNFQFYVQTLHLMNKMNLDPPFNDINDEVKDYIKKSLSDVDIHLSIYSSLNNDPISSDESEMSCTDEAVISTEIHIPKPVKRRKIVKNMNKRLILQQNIKTPNQQKKITKPEEVFENANVSIVKKIEINVNSISKPSEPPIEAVGSIGKMDIPQSDEKSSEMDQDTVNDSSQTITMNDILTNKVPLSDMKSLPVFKNYDSGTPSMRLYIKNLAKGVTAQDIEAIYKRYIISENPEENKMFDVRVMQEGRMKGQAFVTLPNLNISQKALDETNGFIFKNKPMVVQFARTANK